jgi:hypothetical protein
MCGASDWGTRGDDFGLVKRARAWRARAWRARAWRARAWRATAQARGTRAQTLDTRSHSHSVIVLDLIGRLLSVGNGANLCFVRDRTAAKTAAIITTASSTTAPAFLFIHHALSTAWSFLQSSNYLPTLVLLLSSLIRFLSRSDQSQLTTCAPSSSSLSLVSTSTTRF